MLGKGHFWEEQRQWKAQGCGRQGMFCSEKETFVIGEVPGGGEGWDWEGKLGLRSREESRISSCPRFLLTFIHKELGDMKAQLGFRKWNKKKQQKKPSVHRENVLYWNFKSIGIHLRCQPLHLNKLQLAVWLPVAGTRTDCGLGAVQGGAG